MILLCVNLAWLPEGTIVIKHNNIPVENDKVSAVTYLEIVSFMLRFADLVLSRHEALLRGQVVGPGKPLFSGSAVNAIYASMPVIFEEGFKTFENSSPPTVLVWLIPIFPDEAKYIEEHGWEDFEDILERKDPDLWDFGRQSVITSLV